MILLGLDPGLASLGVAIVEKDGRSLRVVALDVLRTAKSPRKAGILQSEDTTERLGFLAGALAGLLLKYRPVAFCMESFSPPRSASVAAKCGMTVGLVVGLAAFNRLPVFQASPQTIRRRLGLPKGATKGAVWEAVWEAIESRRETEKQPAWIGVWGKKPPPVSQREHALDALAAAVVCAPEVIGS